MTTADGAGSDEDGINSLLTFETGAMKPAVGTTALPPADGIRPGDMFFVIGSFGNAWWGDAVDSHLTESNGPGKLGFAFSSSMSSTAARENSGSVRIFVERTEGTDGTATVGYATADGTAIAGKNYTAQSGTLTFAPGEILKTISIPLIDDSTYGGDVQFTVNLSNAAGASLATAQNTIFVTDDEPPPVLSLQLPATSVAEGDIGTVDLPIVVKLTGPTSLPVTVNGSFREGPYNQPVTVQLQFAPGETQKTFTASYVANTIPEPNRTITVSLGNAVHATAPADQVSITIVDDDFSGVSIADASVTESAGKVVVPLQLSRASQKPVTVTYTTRNVTALGGIDYAPTSGTVAVNHGSSITIPILNDQYSEPVKAFEIVLTSVTGGKLDRAVGVVTILDDDAGAPPRPPPEHHRAARH